MFMLSHLAVIFLSGDLHMVFRTSLIFLGFMRFGANETHEMVVCFLFPQMCFGGGGLAEVRLFQNRQQQHITADMWTRPSR